MGKTSTSRTWNMIRCSDLVHLPSRLVPGLFTIFWGCISPTSNLEGFETSDWEEKIQSEHSDT